MTVLHTPEWKKRPSIDKASNILILGIFIVLHVLGAWSPETNTVLQDRDSINRSLSSDRCIILLYYLFLILESF